MPMKSNQYPLVSEANNIILGHTHGTKFYAGRICLRNLAPKPIHYSEMTTWHQFPHKTTFQTRASMFLVVVLQFKIS